MSTVNLPWVNDHNGMTNWNMDTSVEGWRVSNVVGTWSIYHLTSPHTFVGEQSSYYGGGFSRLKCDAATAVCRGYTWRGLSLSSSELNRPMRFSTLMYSSVNDSSISMQVNIGSSVGGSEFYQSTKVSTQFLNLGNQTFIPTTSTIYVSVWMFVTNPLITDYIGIDYFSLDRQENALVNGVATSWSSEALISGTSWSND